MFLERLEMQGFKSFASKTALEFGRGITAIVGPNGSGKSNIADAIRWVLGEQSLKLIRGKKAEDAIFAGSDKKTKLGAAEVSLFLNNEDRAAPIDFSELVITRRVFRDGTGEYLINKRPVRLADIQMLLAKANFGQRTYSVIGQGMVDSFLVTSPQERKHFFDEAAGVRQYQLKRDQTINKLEHTRENLRQAEALLQEIEPRLRSLTRQVRRLERRTEVEQQLTAAQVKAYRGTLQELRSQLSRAQHQLSQFESERVKHDRVVQELHRQLSKLEQEQSRSEAFAALQRDYERTQANKSVLLAEQAVLTGQRDAVFAQQGKVNVVWLEKQAAAVAQQLAEVVAEATGLEHGLGVEQSKLTALEAEEAGRRKAYERLEAEVHDIHAALAHGAVTLPEVQREFTEFVGFEQAFVAELRGVTAPEQLAKLQRRADELDQRTERLAARLERIGATVTAEQVVELQDKVRQALSFREAATQRANDLRLSVRLKMEKVAQLQHARQRLEEERDRLDRELARARAETEEDAAATSREQSEALAKKIAAVDKRLAAVTAELQRFNETETKKRDELFRVQRELRTAQDQLNQVVTKQNEVKIEVARLETRLQDVEREVREEVKEQAWSPIFDSRESTAPPTPEQLDEVQRFKHQLGLIGGLDEGVEQEYTQTNERYTFLKTQYDDLIKASAQLEAGIVELDQTIKERFDDAFHKINQEFGKFFKSLFSGGSAKLVLLREEVVAEPDAEAEEDETDDDQGEVDKKKPAQGEKVVTGIEIQATPPGKRLKGIAMLSGGERALTSIALICAIISNNPSPFVVLDEVDAALDEANSQRFAAILAHLAKQTQFVTITHNRATMEKANILYGVTMGDDGVSRMLSVKLEEAEHVIKRYGNR
ncbi:MAG: chromosome segregation protein SMC [Candidatus Kerfeldbacteria bacterium]|nr:chromosome segregation protein SMC [Candidatus Kerfeldbacteria bacterium]